MIILLHGKDTFRSLRKYRSIKYQAQAKEAEVEEVDFDPQTIDGKEAEHALRNLHSKLHTPLLFSNSQLLIVKNLGQQSKHIQKEAESVFSTQSDREGVVVLFLEYQALPKKHTFYTHLQKQFTLKEECFNPLKGEEQVGFIQKLSTEDMGMQLDRQAIQTLNQRYDGNLFGIRMALHTLKNFYPEASQITFEEVEALFPASAQEKIFDLSRYFLEGKTTKGLQILSSLEQQGEEGLRVHGFLLSQLKKALFIKDVRVRNISDIEQIGGNPKGLHILERQVAYRSRESLLESYLDLIEVDKHIKHGEQDSYPALREYFVRHSSRTL